MKILDIDVDSLSTIFEYLNFKDAVNLCYTSKEHYLRLIIFCYRNSSIGINLSNKEVFFSKYRKRLFSFGIFTSFSTFDYSLIKTIELYDQIKNITYLNSINELDKLTGLIPKKLKAVHFGRKFNAPWNRKFLPDSVESICFHEKCKFNYNISAVNMPNKLTKITFGYMFNKTIDNLPNTVETIIFCKNSRFDTYISRWPLSLREIYIGANFGHPLIIPEGVVMVHFTHLSCFNNDIKWPSTIEKVFFGKKFNQPIDSLLTQPYIIHIKFYALSIFNQPILCNNQSSPIQSITFGKHFNQPLFIERMPQVKSIKFAKKSKFKYVIPDI